MVAPDPTSTCPSGSPGGPLLRYLRVHRAGRTAGPSGPAGAEELSEILNAYFGRLIAMILDHGGDVLKLAGDSLVAFWPASDEPLAAATLRAGQCGLAMQASLTDHSETAGVRLLSKIGIGAGEIAALHVGGVRNRWELLIMGEPLVQIGLAENAPGRATWSSRPRPGRS